MRRGGPSTLRHRYTLHDRKLRSCFGCGLLAVLHPLSARSRDDHKHGGDVGLNTLRIQISSL